MLFCFLRLQGTSRCPIQRWYFFLPPSNVAELVVQDGCTVLLAPEEVSCESFCEVHDGRGDGYFKLYMGPAGPYKWPTNVTGVIFPEVVTVGGGDVDLVEMRIFHTSASFPLQMKQIKTFALLSLQMNQKNLEKTKKKNSRHYMATPLAPCSLWSFFFVFCFLVFSRFLAFWVKNQKNLKKPKKQQKKQNSRHYMATPLAPCSLWSFIFFLVFSGFLALWVKNQKNFEKTKNTKQTKTLDTIWLPPWPHVVCGVLFFFGFLEVFGILGQKPKKPRGKKKQKKNQNSRHYMATPLAPCSLWFFFLFFFCFLKVFGTLGQKPKKLRENQKKQKNKTLDTIWLPPWPHVVCGVFFCFFLFSRGFWHFGSKTKKRGGQWQRVGSCHFFLFFFCVLSIFFGKSTEVNHREERLLRRIFFFKELTT